MIGGMGSSCGKTTAVCGLLHALKERGEQVASFKCGPDYIDPMFHEEVLGVPSSNLDLFLCGGNAILNILGEKGREKISVIEGVMGFYDGLGGVSSDFSTYDISRVTDTPVILIVDCCGKSLSVAAEINGFLNFLPNNIKGVILNRVSPTLEKTYRRVVEENTDAEVYGILPKINEIELKSRRLGLIMASEIDDIKKKMDILGETATKYLDIDSIISLAGNASDLQYDKISINDMGFCKIGVAKDAAFCFYYKENLELLEKAGAEIIYFSPLNDKKLPEDVDGLIFGGGYPELYLEKLSGNLGFIEDIKKIASSGAPIFAECGGFMYLQEQIRSSGENYPLCGILQGESMITGKLQRFGYAKLAALDDNIMFPKGAEVNVHEFHYSDSSHNGDSFLATKATNANEWRCIAAKGNIFAGYPHFHFYGNTNAIENFVKACANYRIKKRGIS